MRSLIAALCLTASAAWPRQIRVSLPADFHYATAHHAYLAVHTYVHGRAAPMTLTGSAEGIVDGVRKSFPLEITTDGSDGGQYLVQQTWQKLGVWVLAIVGDDGAAGLMIGIRNGVPVIVRELRQADGASRPATPDEVTSLLRSLESQRSALSAPRNRRASRRVQDFGTSAVD